MEGRAVAWGRWVASALLVFGAACGSAGGDDSGGGGEGEGGNTSSSGTTNPSGTTFCTVVETRRVTCPPGDQDEEYTSICEENVEDCDTLVPPDESFADGDCIVDLLYSLSQLNPGGQPYPATCADYHAWNDTEEIECIDSGPVLGQCGEFMTCQAGQCLCDGQPLGPFPMGTECDGDVVVFRYPECSPDGPVEVTDVIEDCGATGGSCQPGEFDASCQGVPPGP